MLRFRAAGALCLCLSILTGFIREGAGYWPVAVDEFTQVGIVFAGAFVIAEFFLIVSRTAQKFKSWWKSRRRRRLRRS